MSYHVKLLEVSTGMNYMYHRSGSHTEILITGLHPFYEYNCSVSAETSAGRGPSSVPFTVRTHADGECHSGLRHACIFRLYCTIDLLCIT